jgi:hypothetical protein
MELREKIRSLVSLWALNGSENPFELADDILAIPEIAEALELVRSPHWETVRQNLTHRISTAEPD